MFRESTPYGEPLHPYCECTHSFAQMVYAMCTPARVRIVKARAFVRFDGEKRQYAGGGARDENERRAAGTAPEEHSVHTFHAVQVYYAAFKSPPLWSLPKHPEQASRNIAADEIIMIIIIIITAGVGR